MIEHVESPPRPEKPKTIPAGKDVKLLPAAPKPKRRWLGMLLFLLVAGAAWAGFRYYQASEKKKAAVAADLAARQAKRAVSVAVAPARRSDIPIILRGLGTVTAYNTVNVKSRVDGPLVAVNFTEGQHVNKGDVLMEIDPRTF